MRIAMMPDCNGKMFEAYVEDLPGIGRVVVDKAIAELTRQPQNCMKQAIAEAKREVRQ